MSLFARPESPPPRAPSPELPPAPLPYPHHARRVPSQPRIRVQTPTMPPGLQTRPKGLHAVRSCDNMYQRNVDTSAPVHRLQSSKSRTRSAMTMLSPSDTAYSSPSSSARNSADFTPGHRRTLSVAIARPATSPNSSYPPPLPHSTSQEPPKPIYASQPLRHIYLSDIHQPHPRSPSQPKPSVKQVVLPPLEKHKNLGAACLKLFRIRPSKQQRSTIVSV